jgi:serine protease Do
MQLIRRRRPFPVSAVIALMSFATVAQAQSPAKRPSDNVSSLTAALESTAQAASTAVVQIFATSYVASDLAAATSPNLITTERASGSGVIVDPSGYIVTNAHVVRGAQQVRVEIQVPTKGQSILRLRRQVTQADVVGLDLETDIAVLKVAATNLPALAFGNSDNLRAGQLVLAIGNPMGLDNTVSLGVVSSVARQLEPESPMVYVQTDAPITRGSSGGPLVDLRGDIVGINTMILSDNGAYQGIGFAAPINIVRAVYEQLRKGGRVRRGDIGIGVQTLTPLLAEGLGLDRDDGVVVSDVRPGGMADRAGLRVGDIVLTLDGKDMENGRQLLVGLYRHYVGEVITLEVLRGGKVSTYPVAVSERSDPLSDLSNAVDPRMHLVPALGILGGDLDPRTAALIPNLRVQSGVVVLATVGGAVDIRDGGLQAGDVIYAVNNKAVASLAQLRAALSQFATGAAIVLSLNRRGELLFLAFPAE